MSQEQEREFSSIFAFKMKVESSSSPPPAIQHLTDLLIARAFRFEVGNYKPGFTKPTLFNGQILLVPYYEITEEQVTEDITKKENPGEIITETKVIQVQKVIYIIDTNVYASQGMVLVCRANSLDHAQQLLDEYLQTIRLNQSCTYSFVYNQSSSIMQQLLMTLYDYWPTVQSQVTSVRIGGKTIAARYSGRGNYDVRLEDAADKEIRNRIANGEQIENITLKPPIGLTGIKMSRFVPKITIDDIGIVNCRANINYENFALVKAFIDETKKMVSHVLKGERSRGYTKIDEFDLIGDKPSVKASSGISLDNG
jgi:hypothetical protein